MTLAFAPAVAHSAELGPSRLEQAFFGGASASSHDISRLPFWANIVERQEPLTPEPAKSPKSGATRERGYLRDPRSVLAEVNQRINATPFVTDRTNWSASDYWASPREFAERGGDCEDFAVAKYFELRALGFSADALRVVVVVDDVRQVRHAVLMVELAGEVMVLDNLYDNVMPASSMSHYRPLMAMNETSWQLAAPALRQAPTTARNNRSDVQSDAG